MLCIWGSRRLLSFDIICSGASKYAAIFFIAENSSVPCLCVFMNPVLGELTSAVTLPPLMFPVRTFRSIALLKVSNVYCAGLVQCCEPVCQPL